MTARRSFAFAGLAALVLFGLAQLVPYRITNPPGRDEPKWTNEEAHQLIVAACFDCHSNQTEKPWYSNIAPVSWWTANHVKEGRAALNFDAWSSHRERNPARQVQNGSMPPANYTWFGLHSDAKLTPQERAKVVAELQAIAAQ